MKVRSIRLPQFNAFYNEMSNCLYGYAYAFNEAQLMSV